MKDIRYVLHKLHVQNYIEILNMQHDRNLLETLQTLVKNKKNSFSHYIYNINVEIVKFFK